MTSSQPSCFISYSWDSQEHKSWVRWLAEQLQISGVQTRLDQWDLRLGMNITQYMEESISNSDYVLMICTPGYAERANNATGGVGWEKQIITGEMYYRISSETKFVPLLRHNDQTLAIPHFLLGKYYADFSKDDLSSKFEGLLRHFYDSPQYVRPQRGNVPLYTSGSSEISNWKATSSTILSEIFELSEMAEKWNSSNRPYHYVEQLSDNLKGLIRHPPVDVASATEPLRSFLLLAGLHHGGNWLHWVRGNLDSHIAVETIASALKVSYVRVRFRALYSLQFFDPQVVLCVVKQDSKAREIVENFVINRNVMLYLEDILNSTDRQLADKAGAVMREIEIFGTKED